MEGNNVETLVSGPSVGTPITTGRSDGEKNKQVSITVLARY